MQRSSGINGTGISLLETIVPDEEVSMRGACGKNKIIFCRIPGRKLTKQHRKIPDEEFPREYWQLLSVLHSMKQFREGRKEYVLLWLWVWLQALLRLQALLWLEVLLRSQTLLWLVAVTLQGKGGTMSAGGYRTPLFIQNWKTPEIKQQNMGTNGFRKTIC